MPSGRQKLIAVINWSAAVQEIGGPGVMGRQIRRLLDVMDQENIIFRVVLTSAGAHAAYGASFTIMDFDNDIELPTVVACDTLESALIYEQPAKVETYVSSFDMLWPFADKGDGKQRTVEFLENVEIYLKTRTSDEYGTQTEGRTHLEAASEVFAG